MNPNYSVTASFTDMTYFPLEGSNNTNGYKSIFQGVKHILLSFLYIYKTSYGHRL